MNRVPRMLVTASLTALVASGCSMPWSTTAPASRAQRIPPRTYPSMTADDERGAYGWALWMRGWAERKGTPRQQQLAETVLLVGGSWRNKGDLAVIAADITSRDQASRLVDIFTAARAENHEYRGTAAVAVYDKRGTMLLYRS